MKIQKLFVAALAASAMTVSSHAQNASPSETKAETRVAGSAQAETFGDLMKQVLRAGNASVRASSAGDGVEVASAAQAVASAGKQDAEASSDEKDNLTTASVKPNKDGRPYHGIISRYAGEYGVPVSLAHAVVMVESSYRETARGSAGEIGLMQIKPATARGMGYRGSAKALYNPENNIKYGMRYLAKAYKLSGGDTCGTILRYNAGHGAKRMNPISSAYCKKVQRILATG